MTFSGGQNYREEGLKPTTKRTDDDGLPHLPTFSFGFRVVANRALNLGELLPQVLIGKKIGPSYGK